MHRACWDVSPQQGWVDADLVVENHTNVPVHRANVLRESFEWFQGHRSKDGLVQFEQGGLLFKISFREVKSTDMLIPKSRSWKALPNQHSR